LSTERLWETMAALKTMVSPDQKGRVNYTEIRIVTHSRRFCA
jgi:hypothetical protein